MTASQLERVHNALRQLTLIEASADCTSYLDSCENIDKRRIAIREAAREATREIELALHVHWVWKDGGPVSRDGSPLPRRSRKSARR